MKDRKRDNEEEKHARRGEDIHRTRLYKARKRYTEEDSSVSKERRKQWAKCKDRVPEN